ncbi:FAD-dependent monooxygenase [Sphingobium sp. H39-3-25]|uniref:FAD-dependent monooxygenase n=1 Tax=Sphingobium arseniciresistens TaxID=3030834 RepID=UPI0023B8CB72|nr:FAD-dependent monooxygenase [Sphingobium arseniciresistens]
MKQTEIAIVGAGLGGLAAGLALLKRGYDVHVYEQAETFSRTGAGIQLGPNVLKIMRHLGLEAAVEAMGFKPDAWLSYSEEAELLADIPLNRRRQDYGAAYVTIHRGDFHAVLVDHFPADRLHFGCRLVGLTQDADGATLSFADGEPIRTRLVVGADGVNSAVREALLGAEAPLYTGYVGHRAIFPAERFRQSGFEFLGNEKWWSKDRHFVVYFLDDAAKEMYFVTGAPEAEWNHGASFAPCTKEELREAFADYHPKVQAMIDAAGEITKWPLLTRPPLALWSEGRVVLLGDACHPMKPHMAQGAAMAIEDSAMLDRCLAEVGGLDGFAAGFALYEANRRERASRVQATSNANTWLRTQEDPDWVYGYDVFTVPLVEAQPA